MSEEKNELERVPAPAKSVANTKKKRVFYVLVGVLVTLTSFFAGC